MTTTHKPRLTEVHYDPDCHPEQLEQVLRALDQWADRTARHINHQRQNNRHNYRTSVTIELQPTLSQHNRLQPRRPHVASFRQIFHVQARNVSQSGLGFVAPAVFMPRLLSDDTPLVRSEVIFCVGAPMTIRLHAPGNPMPTLRAEVTRLRPVHLGFFDIGVRFLARDDAGQAPSNGALSN